MRWRFVVAMIGVVALVVFSLDYPLVRYVAEVERDRIVTAMERDAYVLAGRASQTALVGGAANRQAAEELMEEFALENDETAAIIECVDDLFKTYGSKIFFSTTLEEDDLLVNCFIETPDGRDSHWIPFPSEYETKTLTFANGKVYRLIGDKIPVAPRQLGLSPWEFVEVKLTNYDED